jgi:tRNA threonylcarbamoyl adenosine modification protein (Sua5/YciO/YrdC/YwlC family)
VLIDEGEAIDRLARGEVVALPTDTVYGLAVALNAPDATRALFELKERPNTAALPVLIAEPTDAGAYAHFAVDLTRHWPGALTIIGERTALSEDWDLGGDDQTVGLRCPDDPAVRRIAAMVGPLATTSANKHGDVPCTTASEVEDAFGDAIPVLDGGVRDAEPSTVVDATTLTTRVLREGSVVID